MTTTALIATRKGLFRATKSNAQWILQAAGFSGAPVSMVLADDQNQTWYAALDHGHFGVKLHRSADAGASWKEVAAPVYPAADKADEGASLEMIWSLEFAEAGNSQKLWAGTIPGGLFYSADGGASWTLNHALWKFCQQQKWFGGGFPSPGIHSICVHPENHDHIVLGVSCAGVWQTTDFGASWQTRSQGLRNEYMPPGQEYEAIGQDPHRLVQCANHPGLMWIQHHNGIFRSVDGAKNWQEITGVKPSVFGFAVVVHPEDGNTAWFVPGVKDECRIPVDARLVVNRTRDGGKTFEALTVGLPQDPSYDLVYRHGLDIDKSGNCLIMGSTTGNCWLSEDQGDNWQCLSNYLPPVYAVRFVN